MDSYNEILDTMVERYTQLSGIVPSNESDIMLRFKVLASELYNTMCAMDYLKTQMFCHSATGEYLDKHASVRGLTRKSATYATGELTFSLSDYAVQQVFIPTGTVVSTNSSHPLQFETTQDAVINAGELSVTVGARALVSSESYNVLPKEITVMVTPPAGVASVVNKKAFTGGSDEESDEDLRARVLDSYKNLSNGTNAAYYKKLSQAVSGVYSAGVISGLRGNATVDVYVCGKGKAVTYKEIQEVQKILDENRELNVDILVLYAKPVDSKFLIELEVEDGYEFNAVKAELVQQITDYVNSLGVGKSAMLTQISDLIYHTKGVRNFCLPEGYNFDICPSNDSYCVVSDIEVRQVTAW